MNFLPHHISTQSKPSNVDFPKIVDFRKKRNFLKMMVKFRIVWKDLAFAGKYNSLKNGFCSNCQQKCYIQMLHYWCRQHNFLLKCCKSWKNLVFVGKYNSPNDRSLQLLSTKSNFAHFVSFPLGGNLLIDLFWQNRRLLKALKL